MTVSRHEDFVGYDNSDYVIALDDAELELIRSALLLYSEQVPFGMAQQAGYLLGDIERGLRQGMEVKNG